MNILRIDASARTADSVTRQLADTLLEQLQLQMPVRVQRRDVSQGLPFINADWVAANFTRAEQRSAAQQQILALSASLVQEIQDSDILLITAPIYNFSVPATLKAWIDLVARAGLTFRYTSEGPVGLLQGKKAVVIMASGGTGIGSEIDFASPYLRHVMRFIGIDDVSFINAERYDAGDQQQMDGIAQQIEALTDEISRQAA